MKTAGERHSSNGVYTRTNSTWPQPSNGVEKRNPQRPVDPEEFRRRTITVIFISLLMDLLAFTMILPLLPSLLDYYRQSDKSGLFPFLQRQVRYFQELFGAPDSFNSVLFGGLIGSLYSFLQYLVSPVIGALSDVYGRKPVLLLCIAGEAVAYSIWALASNFTIFVVARIVGGIANGNVSLCTAIVTDVSTQKTRGKGMALIGVAYSVGFIVGPITGALFSKWAKTQTGQFYIVPALLAFGLAVSNVIYLAMFFKETLPVEKRAKSLAPGISHATNFVSPLLLFNFKAVQKLSKKDLVPLKQLGVIYFVYLFLYAGLEYTLTFLTHLRFEYSSLEQGKMFLFIGIVMACVQGGYVRRIQANSEKKVALRGLMLIIPSFIIVGLASRAVVLYIGLALYSFASASVVPCLTTLAAGYGAYDQKGTVMGIFRSLGALARALGPVIASIAYWSLGSTWSYISGGLLLTVPLFLLYRSKA